MSTAEIRNGSLARRERQKAETRQAILDAARELFVADGVDATTMRAIAAKIGYTPTAIYHHFKDKDALIMELCVADFRALGSALYSIGRIDDPAERMRRMAMAYADFALANASQYRFMFMTEHGHSFDEEAENIEKAPEEDAYAFLLGSVEEGIQRGVFRAEFDEPHTLAQTFWSGIHGVISLWFTHQNNSYINLRDPHQAVERICTVLMRGTLRNPE